MTSGDSPTLLSAADVEHVAILARLAVGPEEVERLRRELGSILGHVATLAEIDTEGVTASAGVLALQNVMAEDEPTPSLPRDQVLANAPEADEGQFRVPPIFEEA